MKHSPAIGTIRELCSLGLSNELLVPALLEALHGIIPSSRNLFDWIDVDGHIQRYYFDGPIDRKIARLYFDEFYNRRERDAMPGFSDLARSDAVIRGAQELNRANFFDSALYNEIWRPQKLHYHLEAIIRNADGRALGSLVLYREKTDPIFTEDEEALLDVFAPYISRAMQLGAKLSQHFTGGEQRRALVNLDAQGSILHMSGNAHQILLLAHGNLTPSTVAVDPCAADFPTLLVLCRALERSPDTPAPIAATLDNAWGRFVFQAQRMMPADGQHAPMIAVTIQHQEAADVVKARALQNTPLSISQKKVCSLLLDGRSQREIAVDLGVAPNTVVDHVRKIYRKLDVGSVDELRALFLPGRA